MIGKILHQLGSALYSVFGQIHDALISPEQPATLTTEQLDAGATGDGPNAPVMVGSFRDTIQYYIGGTFVVTLVLTVLLCRFFPKMGKKIAGKSTPVRRRRKTTRRRTYRKRK